MRPAILRRFTGVLAIVVATTTSGARGAEPESYAVVSLLGDAITLVTYQPTTGSSLDQNIRQQVPTTDAHFDRLATNVALNAIRRASPDAASEGVTLAERSDYVDPARLYATDGTLPGLIGAVRPQLKRADTHWLVVLGKFRGDARLKSEHGSIGSGKLSGLGFYIDGFKRMKSSNTGERGRGFVAPFAYVTVSLVDLRTGAVVRSESATESTTRANVGPDTSLDPWEALTAEQKLRLLDAMLGRALQRAVPQVLAAT